MGHDLGDDSQMKVNKCPFDEGNGLTPGLTLSAIDSVACELGVASLGDGTG